MAEIIQEDEGVITEGNEDGMTEFLLEAETEQPKKNEGENRKLCYCTMTTEDAGKGCAMMGLMLVGVFYLMLFMLVVHAFHTRPSNFTSTFPY